MITKIVLENWKSHYKTELSFLAGTNVLVGISGAGKSSVMDALCFSLFGSFPHASNRTIKLEEVIMSKPSQKNFSRITTHFFYAGKNFAVERTINLKGLNEAKLFEENRLIAGPKPTEVTKRVEEILEVNYELFSRAVYTEQNEADYFLKLNHAQRKEKIDELLMLKKYETVRQNAVSLQNRFRKETDLKKAWLKEQEKKAPEQELVELKKRLFEKQETQKKLLEQKTELEESRVGLEEKVKALSQNFLEFQNLKENLIRLQAQLAAKQRQAEQAAQFLEKHGALDLEKEKQKNLDEKHACKKEIEGTQKEAEEITEKLAGILSEKSLAVEQTARAQKYLLELKTAGAACPVCRRGLEEHSKEQIMHESLAEKKAFEEKTGILEKQALTEKNRLEQAKKLLTEKQSHLFLLQRKELELEGIAEKAKEHKKISEETIALAVEKNNALKRVEQNPFDEKELDAQKNSLAKITERFFSIQKELASIEEFTHEIQTGILRTQKSIEEKNRLEKETEFVGMAAEKTGLFVGALKAAQTELRSSLISTINEALSDIWQHVYPYDDLTACRIEVTDDGNYDIRVLEKNGAWKKVEGILSGGERSCVAVSIRIAISLVLAQNLGWLILDEPTHNLDKNTVKKFSGFLKTHLPQLIDQVFIITHEKEMEQAASASLYFFERQKTDEGPTQVSAQEII